MSLSTPPDVPLADVKWRVQGRPTNSRAQFVPYVDAVIIASLLDQWVGPENWSDEYVPAHGKGLWCRLSIRVGDEWVSKTDIGVPSNMEAEKGQVSDAFKRAGTLKWGVGRNVYRLPNLWAPCDEKTNAKGEKNAYPNAQTIPAIIAELTKRGFSDAAASEATADHDDEPEPMDGWTSIEEQDEAHNDLKTEISGESPEIQAAMRDYRKAQGYGWPMSMADLLDMRSYLTGQREVEREQQEAMA